MLGYTTIASSLLDVGVDPNSQSNPARLGKVTDRKQQRSLFKSNPLHLACLRGNPFLVKKLLQKGEPIIMSCFFCDIAEQVSTDMMTTVPRKDAKLIVRMQVDPSLSISHAREEKAMMIVSKKTATDYFVSSNFQTLEKYRSLLKTGIGKRYFIVRLVPDIANYCGM